MFYFHLTRAKNALILHVHWVVLFTWNLKVAWLWQWNVIFSRVIFCHSTTDLVWSDRLYMPLIIFRLIREELWADLVVNRCWFFIFCFYHLCPWLELCEHLCYWLKLWWIFFCSNQWYTLTHTHACAQTTCLMMDLSVPKWGSCYVLDLAMRLISVSKLSEHFQN